MQFWARNFFPTLTAALALVACGDNGGGTTTDAATTTGASTSGDASTSDSPTTAASTSGASNSGSTSGDASTSGDPPTTGEPATTTGPDATTTTDATASTTDPGTTTGGDPVAQCLMMIEPGDACGECACNNCLEDLQACQADEGCTAIRMCAQDNMCGGIDCLGPCGATIDKYGGLGGKSAQLGLALSGCIDDSCADQCG